MGRATCRNSDGLIAAAVKPGEEACSATVDIPAEDEDAKFENTW